VVNVVDSSGWLEHFAGTPRADLFASAIERTKQLIVPVISFFEVFRKRGENAGLQVYAVMSEGRVVDLDATVWTQDRHFQGLPESKIF
jgi:predicted nucleic acid-binding protein